MEPDFENHEDFERNMKKLLGLLKKILKDHKIEGHELGQIFDKASMNLNLCFFTFLPIGQEDFEEMEAAFEELLEHGEVREVSGRDNIKFELNARDIDFLRKHGIKF